MADDETPEDLARELGVPGKTIRDWLRAEYPRTPSEAHQRWHLTPDQAAAVRRQFPRARS